MGAAGRHRILTMRREWQSYGKEELGGYNIDDEVIQYIATNIKSNIRELEGSPEQKPHRHVQAGEKEINLDLAKDASADMISSRRQTGADAKIIIQTVAEHFGISTKDILGQKRNAEIVFPRQIAMYLCRNS